MLDAYRERLAGAGWVIEAGESVLSDSESRVLWLARKNGVTFTVGNKTVSVARGNARSTMPLDLVLNGFVVLPGALSERYLPIRVSRSDLIPHEGPMTEEEVELLALLQAWL
jgi:hypothetical protein